MKKYIIMSDLDGTLLNKKSKISLYSRLYIKRLMKNGHHFIMSTGRPYQGAKAYIKELKPEILVSSNGGAIHFLNEPEKDIYYTISKERFIELLDDIDDYIISAYSGNMYHICMENEGELPFWIKHIDESRDVRVGKLRDIINHNPINPNLFIKREGKEFMINLLNTKYKELGFRIWHRDSKNPTVSVELFNKEATKGHALKKLKEILGVDYENDLVFGDELNDIEMLKEAYNSVAICSGRSELKDISKYVSKYPNYKNGEVKFIKEFFKKNNIK